MFVCGKKGGGEGGGGGGAEPEEEVIFGENLIDFVIYRKRNHGSGTGSSKRRGFTLILKFKVQEIWSRKSINQFGVFSVSDN